MKGTQELTVLFLQLLVRLKYSKIKKYFLKSEYGKAFPEAHINPPTHTHTHTTHTKASAFSLLTDPDTLLKGQRLSTPLALHYGRVEGEYCKESTGIGSSSSVAVALNFGPGVLPCEMGPQGLGDRESVGFPSSTSQGHDH